MNKGVDFFYHATGDDDESLKRMLAIIESGAIYSKRKLGITDRGLFNGQNYISVAAWNDDMNINDHQNNFGYSSFYGFVFNLPCFIVTNEIPAIKCELSTGSYDPEVDRVSQYVDEWHVKDEIPISKVVGIALPDNELCTEEDQIYINKILKYAEIYNWEVFVSDVNLIEAVRTRFGNKKNVL